MSVLLASSVVGLPCHQQSGVSKEQNVGSITEGHDVRTKLPWPAVIVAGKGVLAVRLVGVE